MLHFICYGCQPGINRVISGYMYHIYMYVGESAFCFQYLFSKRSAYSNLCYKNILTIIIIVYLTNFLPNLPFMVVHTLISVEIVMQLRLCVSSYM